jgi:hypothetical protein
VEQVAIGDRGRGVHAVDDQVGSGLGQQPVEEEGRELVEVELGELGANLLEPRAWLGQGEDVAGGGLEGRVGELRGELPARLLRLLGPEAVDLEPGRALRGRSSRQTAAPTSP